MQQSAEKKTVSRRKRRNQYKIRIIENFKIYVRIQNRYYLCIEKETAQSLSVCLLQGN